MKFENFDTDDAILKEIGSRLAQRRIHKGITQATLSREAGVSKRTIERIEAGSSAQTVNIVRILRILELVSNLDQFLPEETTRPMELLRQQKKKYKRASSRRSSTGDGDRKTTDWTWGDET